MLEGLELIRDLPVIGQIEEVQRVIEQILVITSVIGGILALLQCFFGYRMLRFWVTVIGALLGFAIGFGITMGVTEGTRVPLAVVVGIVAAVLLAILSFKLYLVGVFLLCGFLAAFAVSSLPIPREGGGLILTVVLLIAAFVIGGILAVKFQRHVVIVITAVTGGISAVSSFSHVIPELGKSSQTAAIATLILIALGLLVQYMTTREKKRRS